jgi:hypothetical protein
MFEVLQFTKAQSITNAEIASSPDSMEAWTHLIIQCQTISKVPRGCCEWFDRNRKCVAEVSLYFKLKMDTLGGLNDPTD